MVSAVTHAEPRIADGGWALADPVLPERQRILAHLAPRLARFVALRRQLHQFPELAYHEHRTSRVVAGHLRAWGYAVTPGLAGTGVVGAFRRGEGRQLTLCASMDALPLSERSGLSHESVHEGVMHACGHDGHVASLMAAAWFLARHGRFKGNLHLVFVPAGASGGGALRMVQAGLFDRFPTNAVYALHDAPDLPVGWLGCATGPALPGEDVVLVRLSVGQTGARPSPDTVGAATRSLASALQGLSGLHADSHGMVQASVDVAHAGGLAPHEAFGGWLLRVTLRSCNPLTRKALVNQASMLTSIVARRFRLGFRFDVRPGYPTTTNWVPQAGWALQAAADVLGWGRVMADAPIGAESSGMAHLLQHRPGACLFVGQGTTAALCSAAYDFNDEALLPAALWWVRVTESFLA